MQPTLQLDKASRSSNNVVHFPVKVDGLPHLVRVGSYVTCSCHGDWSCPALRKVVQRLWDTERDFTSSELCSTARMPPLVCNICLEESRWGERGVTWSFCDTCFKVLHKTCHQTYKKGECTVCREGTLELIPIGNLEPEPEPFPLPEAKTKKYVGPEEAWKAALEMWDDVKEDTLDKPLKEYPTAEGTTKTESW